MNDELNSISTRRVVIGGDLKTINELLTDSQVSQSFLALGSGLRMFGVDFTTWGRIPNCRLNVQILNNLGFILYSKIVHGHEIANNKFHMFRCGIPLNEGHRYAINIRCEKGGINSSVSVKCAIYNQFPVDRFVVNGLVIQGEMHCAFEYGDLTDVMQEIIKEIETPKITEVQSHPRPGLVSIVIPCWNTSDIIEKTLNSIEDQTYTHTEVIVVDDMSDDYDELRKVVESHGCRLLRNDSGVKGACAARNIGWNECHGEYLFFCDSDVMLKPYCLSSMIQALHDNLDSSWAYCNFSVGRTKKKFYPYNQMELRKRNCSSTMSMVRAFDFPGFDPDLRRLQDWDVFLTMAEKGCKGVWVDEFLFHAKDRPGITKNSIGWDEAVAKLKVKHPELGT